MIEKSYEEIWQQYLSSIHKDNLEFKTHLLSLIDEVEDSVSNLNLDERIVPQAVSIIEQRYIMTYSDKEKDDGWLDISKRVARTLASVLTLYFSDTHIDLIRRFEDTVYTLLKYRLFILNSPALFSLGKGTPKSLYKNEISYTQYKQIYDMLDRKNFTSSACFILDIDDSIEGIFKTMSDAGIISKSGGGIGFNIGELRPRYSYINSSDSDSSGSIEFLKMFDAMGEVIKQGNKRRFAGMAVLLDSYDKFWENEVTLHGDILEFINAKKDNKGDNKLSMFNLSIGINNSKSLYDKYVNNENIKLTYKNKPISEIADPKIDRNKYKTEINTQEFMDLISNNAWSTGDPAFIFFDKVNNYNPFRDTIPMKSTNPCFSYNSKLLTDNGYIEIGKLAGKQIKVWEPFERKYKKAVVYESGNKQTITLVLENGDTLTVTPDHILFEVLEHDSGSTYYRAIEAKDTLNKRLLLNSVSAYTNKQKLLIRPSDRKEYISTTVIRIIENGIEPVYDFTVDSDNHVGVVNGVICHNCGERPGISSVKYGIYDTCDLGHLDVSKFVQGTSFLLDEFITLSRFSYYMLDMLHDLMMYPVPEVKKGVLGLRSVGLGFYGLAGSLIKLGIPYDSIQAQSFGYLIMKSLEVSSLYESYLAGRYISPMMFATDVSDTSIYPSELWYRKGVYESYINIDQTKLDKLYDITLNFLEHDKQLGVLTRRNINTTTVAPTGTTSLIGQTPDTGDMGSGIEPIYSFAYTRQVITKDNVKEYKQFVSPLLDNLDDTIKQYVLNNNGSFKGISKINTEYSVYEDIYKTAADIDYMSHLKMQESVQWCCSSSISKTINMSKEVKPDDVKNVFIYAMKSPVIKGVTIYRDGCLDTQVLTTTQPKKIVLKLNDKLSVNIDHKGRINPIDREETYRSLTTKFKTDKGNNYLTLSIDKHGNPIEIFLENSGEKAEIIGRLSSYILRSGGSIDMVINQLKKIKHSYSNTVAAQLEKLVKEAAVLMSNNTNLNKYDTHKFRYYETNGILEWDSRGFYIESATGNTVCPSCGSVNTIVIQEGCQICSVCSNSKCS